MPRVRAATVLMLFAACAFLAACADKSTKVVFHPLKEEAKRSGHVGSYTLSGGKPVSGDDWSTFIMAAFPGLRTADGSIPFCTATFVGRSVVLTAAHCVFDMKTHAPSSALLALENWPKAMTLTCLVDRRYPDPGRDFSLCHIDIPQGALDLLGISRFDSLETGQAFAPGQRIVMTGYGCTNVRFEVGRWQWDPADGWLRIGSATLSGVPGGSGQNRNDYIVVSHGDMPTLCPGDSGGPLIVSATPDHPAPYRTIIAVNRTLDPPDYTKGGYISSRMTAINTPEFSDFLVNTYEHAYPKDSICGTRGTPAGQEKCR